MEKRTRLELAAEELHSAAVHLLRWVRRADASGRLNAARLSALSVVVFGGPISLGKLAEVEQVRPPTMTRVVKALEEMGLLRKVKDKEDGRAVVLSATVKGKRVMLEGRNRRVEALARRIESLEGGEREILMKAAAVMRKLSAA